MTKAGQSVFVFGIYLLVVSVLLVFAPQLLIAPLGLPAPADYWMHVIAAPVAAIGAYYVIGARANNTQFLAMTVTARTVAFAVFILLAAMGTTPWRVAVFGVVDVIGAMWTRAALKVA